MQEWKFAYFNVCMKYFGDSWRKFKGICVPFPCVTTTVPFCPYIISDNLLRCHKTLKAFMPQNKSTDKVNGIFLSGHHYNLNKKEP